jgi:hypothetical protein
MARLVDRPGGSCEPEALVVFEDDSTITALRAVSVLGGGLGVQS